MATIKRKECSNCHKQKAITQFYNSRSNLFKNDGKLPICKICLKEMVNYNDMRSIYSALKQLNLPFLLNVWNNALKNKGDTFGNYMRQINSLPQYANLKWEHSDFTGKEESGKQPDCFNVNLNEDELNELKKKFGIGYKDEEYFLFEKKYQDLRPSFQLLTTMHEECLREYCIDKVKEGLAKARGDFKEAKEWAGMAKDVASSGKLNPCQMSKADLSGGLDTFGQMARMVEQTDEGELLDLLPKFIAKPKDKVDVTLWHYINYIRDLRGMGECDYKDIYQFYEQRKAEYEDKIIDNEIEEVGVKNEERK